MENISGPLSVRKGLLTSALVLTGIILMACGTLPIPKLLISSTPIQPQLTEKSSVGVTPEVSETPFVEMTPTEMEKNEELRNKEEVVKNINEFLNEEGKYSLESFQSQSQYFFGESELREGEIPLGLINTVIGQFILLGSNYDDEAKTMHLYLGTLDIDKRRVVFEYNFSRTFEFGPMEPPITLIERQTALYEYIAANIDDTDTSKIISPDDWESFFAENLSKPISLRWYMYPSDEEMSRFGYGGQAHILEYDLGRELRVVIGERLNQLGGGKYDYQGIVLSEDEIEMMMACLWSKESFRGVESLDAECPSNHGMSNIFVRRLWE